MDIDRNALLDAVNDLIAEDDPRYKVEALDATFALGKLYPVRLARELSVLNALLDLRGSDEVSFENIKKLIDKKRDSVGKPPCWPELPPEKFDKTEYQRQPMAQRRERAGRAADIENSQRPERDKLRGNPRLEFERQVLASWGEGLSSQLEIARTASGGRLTRSQQDAIRTRYWESVDRTLDEREELVRKEMLKPAHQRRKV